ncbi:MAG: type II toxin-antitoxin system antitoxin SocA domain-containing protein [Pseudomonadota bacterium]
MLDDSKYVSPMAVARWFLNRADRDAGEAITPLKLQKLVYYAQAWFLANFDRPIFKDDFEAWAHGPAHPGLYGKYRGFAWEALPKEDGSVPPKFMDGFLSAVYDEYGQYSAKKLERMTHEELPWKEARGNLAPEAASKNKISKLAMRNFYAGRLGKKEIKKIRD